VAKEEIMVTIESSSKELPSYPQESRPCLVFCLTLTGYDSWAECQTDDIARRSVYFNDPNNPRILNYPASIYGLVVLPSWWSICRPGDVDLLEWLGFTVPKEPTREERERDKKFNSKGGLRKR